MKIYSVYTSNVSYKPEFQVPATWDQGHDIPIYVRRVRADSKLEALGKCLPDIRKELPKIKGKYLSVFVGEKCNSSAYASRLHPFQIVVETGEIR
jgi:hypothetical protein